MQALPLFALLYITVLSQYTVQKLQAAD